MFHSPKHVNQEKSPKSIPAPQTETAGPSSNSSSKVRKSIDNWETKGPGARREATVLPATTPPIAVAPLRPKPKAVPKAPVEASGGSPGTAKEQPKPTDRVTQARILLRKAKTYLGESRNLKTDLKAGITLALDELFRLIKEEAAESKKDHGTIKDRSEMGTKGTMTSSLLSSSSTVIVGEEKSKEDDIIKMLEWQNKKLEDTQTEVKNMREAISSWQSCPPAQMTYAEVASASANPKNSREPPLHSILIAPKNDNDTGDQLLERVRRAVNAKDGWVTVEKVRKVKDRKIVVGCRTEEQRDKVKERLKSVGDHLIVEEVKNQDPMLVLRDVLSLHSDEDILTALRNQNVAVFRDLDKQEDRVEIKFRKRARNPHTRHVVIGVSPILYNKMLLAEKVHIDMQKVRVADQSPLVQCSMCLGYGHGRRFCQDTQPKCCHCGGLHLREKCADWIAGASPSCTNCTSAKLENREHNAFSEQCPIRRRWEALARAKIAYC